MAKKIIAVGNQKGGVGKTTTAINLAHALAAAGNRVLACDLDPQASLSAALGMDFTKSEPTIYDLFAETPGITTDDVIQKTGTKNVDLLPSTIELANIDEVIAPKLSREYLLANLLLPVRERYEFILLDCPPNLGQLTVNALTAADEIVIPFEPDYLGLRALPHLVKTVKKIQAATNAKLRIAGLVINKLDRRTRHARAIVDEVRKSFPGPVFDSVIPATVVAKDAIAHGGSVINYEPNSAVAQGYHNLAAELQDHV